MMRKAVLRGLVVLSVAACSGGMAARGLGDDAGSPSAAARDGGAGDGATAGSATPSCKACLSDTDCTTGGSCGQFQGDTFCAAACPNGDECGAGTTCTAVTTASGAQTELCVPNNNLCGGGATTVDAGRTRGPRFDAGNFDGATGSLDSGLPPATGTVTADGGTVSTLFFTVVGDTRPATVDDTSAYPTAIIDQIYTDMAGLGTPPLFSISTGDYQYSTPTGTQAALQLSDYLAARAKYSGMVFPAMGNHECTGYTASNCGTGNADGITNNYTAFMQQLLAPIGQALPYYSINVNGADGSWTSKFVFIAANAWDSTQSAWLTSVLAQATTYTFVIRHEAAEANTAPGVTPSEAIIATYPYTMKIVGHTHTYERSGTREVIFGNGGAPLTGSGNYGFGLVQQRADHAIQFDMLDYESLQPDTKFRFAVNADGTPAPP